MTATTRRRASALVATLGLCLGARPAVAGPWVADEPGQGLVSIGYSRYEASEYFRGPGEQNLTFMDVPRGEKAQITVPKTSGFFLVGVNSNYIDNSAQFYGEVSLGKRFAFVSQMPLVHNIRQDLEGGQELSTTGVGDMTLGFKWQAPTIKKVPGLALGLQLYTIAPSGDVNNKSHYPIDPSTMMEAEKPLPTPTGNGTVDIDFRYLSIGYSFYPIPIFMAAELDYHHHFNQAACDLEDGTVQRVKYSDDLPWSFILGASWEPKYKGLYKGTLIANVRGVHSLYNGDVPGEGMIPKRTGTPFSSPCGQANNLSSISMGGTLMYYPVKWVGLAYSVDHTLWGINTGYGLTQSVSLIAEF